VWGTDIELNYLSQRATPTRFLSPITAIGTAAYAPNYLTEYVQTLMANPAQLVLINLNEDAIASPFGPVQNLCPNCSDEVQAELMVLKAYFSQHYILVQTIEGWEVYQWVE
jgi:hypothetical protein